MAELKLSGNHLKGSRPVLSFDQVRGGTLRHLQCCPGRTLLRSPFLHCEALAGSLAVHRSCGNSCHVSSVAVAIEPNVWFRPQHVFHILLLFHVQQSCHTI